MSDLKITDLPSASLPLQGNENLYAVQGGLDVRLTPQDLQPEGIGAVSGSYTTHQAGQGRGASNLSTAAQAVNRIELQPFTPSSDLQIDRVGVVVTSAGSDLKVVLYSSLGGLPHELLWESGTLSGSSTGLSEEIRNFTFERSRLYWIGVRAAGSVTLRGAVVAGLIPIGLSGGADSATSQAVCFRRIVAFASPSPSPFNPDAGELTSTALPYVYFRVV